MSCLLALASALNRETLAAAAGTRCVGVVEVKAFAIQPVRKIKLGAGKVQERFHIKGYAYPAILEELVALFYFVIKIKIV